MSYSERLRLGDDCDKGRPAKERTLKKSLVCGLILQVGLILAFPGITEAQKESQERFTIKGVVSVSKKPLRSGLVVISQNGQEIDKYVTGDDGKYYITNLSYGIYDISLRTSYKKEMCRCQVNLERNTIMDIKIKSTSSHKIKKSKTIKCPVVIS